MRIYQSSKAERLAVSFPLIVAILAFVGWVSTALINSQKQNSGGRMQ